MPVTRSKADKPLYHHNVVNVEPIPQWTKGLRLETIDKYFRDRQRYIDNHSETAETLEAAEKLCAYKRTISDKLQELIILQDTNINSDKELKEVTEEELAAYVKRASEKYNDKTGKYPNLSKWRKETPKLFHSVKMDEDVSMQLYHGPLAEQKDLASSCNISKEMIADTKELARLRYNSLINSLDIEALRSYIKDQLIIQGVPKPWENYYDNLNATIIPIMEIWISTHRGSEVTRVQRGKKPHGGPSTKVVASTKSSTSDDSAKIICFNCLCSHHIKNCKEVRNETRIKQNVEEFRKDRDVFYKKLRKTPTLAVKRATKNSEEKTDESEKQAKPTEVKPSTTSDTSTPAVKTVAPKIHLIPEKISSEIVNPYGRIYIPYPKVSSSLNSYKSPATPGGKVAVLQSANTLSFKL